MRRSLRDCRRSRAATARGLLLSAILVMPVGGTFGWSTLSDASHVPDQCQPLSSSLSSTDQRRLRQYRASNSLTPAQQRALNLRICDPTLISMVPSLAKLVSGGADLEELAARTRGLGDEASTLSVLKALLAQP